MATEVIDITPGGSYEWDQSVDLGDIVVILSFRWWAHIGVWGYQLLDANSNPLTDWLAARAGGDVPFDTREEGAPSGSLVWTGRDVATYSDLGSVLNLEWRT